MREREWEAAQTVWFWRDGVAGMRFRIGRRRPRWSAPNLLLLALASLLVRGGERVGFLGAAYRPAASRLALSRIGHALLDPAAGKDRARCRREPAAAHRARRAARLAGRFLAPRRDRARCGASPALGAVGHLVRIVDPAEEDFPYTRPRAF